MSDGETNYLDKLSTLAADFKNFMKRQGIEEADAVALVEFLRSKGFSDTEIEGTFSQLGYPMKMKNYEMMKDKEKALAERQKSLDTAIGYIKKMSKTEVHLLAEELAIYIKSKKNKDVKHGAKPRYRRYAVTSPVKEEINNHYKIYLVERRTKEELASLSVTHRDAEKILELAAKNYDIEVNHERLISIWQNRFSSSTILDDLGQLLREVGFKSKKPAVLIAKKNNIPVIKGYQIKYVQKVASIIIHHGMAQDVFEYLQNEMKVSVNVNEALTLGNVLKSAVKVASDNTKSGQNEITAKARDWFESLQTARTKQQQETLLFEAINILADIYGTDAWIVLREKFLGGINRMNALDRNTIEDAIRQIDAGQKSERMSEYMVKKALASMLLNEQKTYM